MTGIVFTIIGQTGQILHHYRVWPIATDPISELFGFITVFGIVFNILFYVETRRK